MNEVTQILIFGVPLIGFGIYFDRLLTRSHKIRLHSWLINVWLQIEETTFPDFAKKIAGWVNNRFRAVFEELTKSKIAIAFLSISWLMTSICCLIGRFMEGLPFNDNPFNWLPIFTVYLIEIPLGLIVLFLIRLMLKIILHCRAIGLFLFPLFSIFTCAALAVLSLPIISWASDFAFFRSWPGSQNAIYSSIQVPANVALLGAYFSKESDAYFKKTKDDLIWSQDHYALPLSGGNSIKINGIKFTFHTNKMQDNGILNFLLPEKLTENDAIQILPRQSFLKYFSDNIHGIIFDFKNWTPRSEGTLIGNNPNWAISSVDFSFSGAKWLCVLLAVSGFIPLIIFGVVLVGFGGLKLTRDILAWLIKYLIDRSTEDDPKYNPEKFAPFTLFLSVVGIVLYLFQLLANFVATLII